MKHLLPLFLFFVAAFPAQAQLNPNLLNGLVLGGRLATQGHSSQQKETLYVTPATYQAHTFPQKRTPAKKLPKSDKGGSEVTAMEQFLADRYTAFQTDTTALLLSVAQEKEFSRLRTNLEAFNPFWNTDPYSQEMSFYRQHDDVRRRLALKR